MHWSRISCSCNSGGGDVSRKTFVCVRCSYMRQGLQLAYQSLNIVVCSLRSADLLTRLDAILHTKAHVMGVLVTLLCGCEHFDHSAYDHRHSTVCFHAKVYSLGDRLVVSCSSCHRVIDSIAPLVHALWRSVIVSACIRPYSVYSKAFSGRCRAQYMFS